MTRRQEFGQRCLQLMEQHGLLEKDWFYSYSEKMFRTLGICKHRDKVLQFSLPYVDNNPLDVLEDTIKHEIAHALVGPGQKHNNIWKMRAVAIGAVPKSCSIFDVTMPISHYAQCDIHGVIGKWYRKPKYMTRRCLKCGSLVQVKEFLGE